MNKEKFYFKNMEAVEDDSQFFDDLCGLIDEYADDNGERLRYLCALADFRSSWMETYGVTGHLWEVPEEEKE